MTNISTLGLGSMGQALAARFHQRGHTVTVWNRTPGKVTSLAVKGAHEDFSGIRELTSCKRTAVG